MVPAKASDFYAGKTLTIVAGFAPGGVYDVTARLLARHIGEHLPGKPTVIVQTMTGAGGLRAAIYLYNNAPRDGTVIAMPSRNYPIAPYSNDQLRYDPRQFNSIGSTSPEVLLGVVWHTVPIKHFDDLMTREITTGVAGFADTTGTFALITQRITGAKMKLVSGYPNGTDVQLAMEKGEVDSEFGWSWGSLKSKAQQWLDQKKINIVLQLGMAKAPDLPDTPFIMDYIKNDLDRKAVEFQMAPAAFAWPFIAPPNVPPDRLAELRRAFDETMRDPRFLAEAKQLKIEINPINSAAMQALVDRVLSFDKTVVTRATELVTPPN